MLKQGEAVLTVVDVQERLLPFIHESESLIQQIVRLVRGFQILQAPILLTEQYRKGLGPTDARILDAMANPPGPAPTESATAPADSKTGGIAAPPFPIEKMAFSCAAHSPYIEELERLGRRQVVLCGIEAHVCVLQTALDLRDQGYEVFLAADAVSSRSPHNVEIALRRMEQAGVKLTSCEMAVFEMLHVSGTPRFKAWSRIIR